MTAGIGGCAHNGATSLNPAPGRETPVGAINTYCKAVENGDASIVADSYDTPRDLVCRLTWAQAQIAGFQLFQAIEACLGPDAGHEFDWYAEGDRCVRLKLYTSADFRAVPGYPAPDAADGKFGPRGSWLPMCRGSDGIWRIDLGMDPIRPIDLRHTIDLEQKRAALYHRLTSAVKQGQISDVGPILSSLEAQDFQISHEWGELDGEEPTEPPLPNRASLDSTNFDQTTPQGAIGAYYRAFVERDEKGIAGFFYSEGDPRGRLAEANAERILAALRFKDAIDRKFNNGGEAFVSDDVGLIAPADLVWWCDVEQERGDHAVGVFENNSQVSFRKVDGVWKLDITPAKPQTPTGLASKMARDSKILDQVTADVLAGKYKELSQVRDALVSVKLTGPVPAAPIPTGPFQ